MLLKLKWFTGVRLLLALAFLGSAVVLNFRERLPFPTSPLYGLLGLTFALSLVYAFALRSQRYLLPLGVVQLILDLGLVSLLVHFTGGLDSAFPFMYIFVVYAAATLLGRGGSLVVAVLSGLLYGGLLLGEGAGIFPRVEFSGGLASTRPGGYAIYQVLIHTVAFVAVAILSSQLAERLRQAGQELERRGLDLRNLQALHRAIVANVPSGLLTLDLAGHVISFNEAAERITGYDFETLRNRPWQETPFAACSGLGEFLARPDRSVTAPATEVDLQRRDGRAIPVGIAFSPLRAADGGAAGLVAIFQDLTEKKRAEERLRRADRLAALGQLAANIAHEIRNPLAAISGSVEVLKEDLSPRGSTRDLLEIILREAGRLKLITGQFLDFSKPMSLLFRPCSVRPLVEETLHLLARSGERHPQTIWTITEEEPDLSVLADSDQLRQVVWNLCLNAIQAMPDGGTLTVSVRLAPGVSRSTDLSVREIGRPDASAQDGQSANRPVGPSTEEWVEIAFEDTGRGIPVEELDRIFDPFYTTRPSGTGLGLAIARKNLESMGGRIRVESRPGTGTTFRMWLLRAHEAVSSESKR